MVIQCIALLQWRGCEYFTSCTLLVLSCAVLIVPDFALSYLTWLCDAFSAKLMSLDGTSLHSQCLCTTIVSSTPTARVILFHILIII